MSNIIFYDFRGCRSVSVNTAIVIQCLYLCRMAFRFLAEKMARFFVVIFDNDTMMHVEPFNPNAVKNTSARCTLLQMRQHRQLMLVKKSLGIFDVLLDIVCSRTHQNAVNYAA